MTHPERTVYGGVDTHEDVHVAGVISATGRLLGTRAYPASPIGLRGIAALDDRPGNVAMVGVEGTGTYGLGLQRVLQDAGVQVVEVNRPNRQLAGPAARATPSTPKPPPAPSWPGTPPWCPRPATASSSRSGSYGSHWSPPDDPGPGSAPRSGTSCSPHPNACTSSWPPCPWPEPAAGAAQFQPGDDTADVREATRAALRVLARQYQSLTADMDLLGPELDTLTTQANPGLRQLRGVGPDTAAALLVAAGDNPERLTSDAAFAALCGASPVDASSGKTTGHRLNRGGNRQANAALHRIVVGRMGHHQPTKDYIARRTAQGKSKKSIMRCLKRYIAREIYSHLVNPRPAEITDDLRPRRTALNIPIRVVALAVGENVMTISRLERGLGHDAELTRRYHTWITQQEAA